MLGLAHTKPQSVKKSNIGRSFFLTPGLFSQKSPQIKVMRIKTKFPFKQWWLGD